MKETEQLSSQKILLVDDDVTVIDAYCGVLAPKYETVLIAPDGEAGLQIALSEVPDLIITGIMMPNLNGLDFINELKMREKTKSIPIIVLTGLIHFKKKALDAGADLYLIKSEILPNEILEPVKKLLDKVGYDKMTEK